MAFPGFHKLLAWTKGLRSSIGKLANTPSAANAKKSVVNLLTPHWEEARAKETKPILKISTSQILIGVRSK